MTAQLHVPWQQAVANLFPGAPVVDGKIVLPYGVAETTILRRLGMQVAAPVLSQYQFTGTRPPFGVQRTTVEMLTMHTHCYVLSGMGVGKTACPLWAYDYLCGQQIAGKMLVVAPLSTLHFTWMAEIFQIMLGRTAVVLHGSRAKRLKLLAEDYDIYIINHDGIGTIYPELCLKFGKRDILTIDELATYRNPGPRTKLMKKFAERFGWVWGMTGAPAPKEPTDVWNQANIVTPSRVPKYFGRFREELMYKVTQFKWLPKEGAAQKAYEVLQPSVRFTLEDVGELPPFISRRIDVDLGAKQRHIYEEIRKSCMAIVGNETVTAANAGVLLSKLLQISLGYVYSEKKGIITLDNQNRLNAVIDLLGSGCGKALIFTSFKHSLQGVADAITSAGYRTAIVSGDTPAAERNRIFDAFQNRDELDNIVAHPQCMAHGITMTAADTVLWFGPHTSLEIYDQANARIRRTGQKKKQQFLHLQATPAEKKIWSMLIARQDVQSQLLKLFEDEL